MLALVLVVLAGAAIRYVWTKRAQKNREIGYQSPLHSYSQVLKPGMTRKDVEDYLRAKDTPFQHICCIDERSAYADITKIGKEGAPWYCSEQNIYVAFQFAAAERRDSVSTAPSDTLRKVTLFRRLEGCL
jgi:hypothetical protein